MNSNIFGRTSLNEIFDSKEINPSGIRNNKFPEIYD